MKVALTTVDNPYSPITEFEAWFNFDTQKGYNSSQYLARIARTSDQLSEKENENEIENAIDEIVKYGFAVDKNGNVVNYKKVKK